MARKSLSEPLPYYKWLWRDWRSNRKVQRMSWQAKGLYRELLDEFWAEGFIPSDRDELADICGCTREEFDQFWPEIEGSWEETPQGLVNRKMDEQRTETDSLRATNARNARDAKLAAAQAKSAGAKAAQNVINEDQPAPAIASELQRPLANAATDSATASARYIAEQSRGEEEQSKAEPPRGKREGASKSASPSSKHAVFRELVQEAWGLQNQIEMPWDAAEGKQLSALIAANPKLGPDGMAKLLKNRNASQGVNFAERPRAWLSDVTRYARGPLDRYGAPLEGAANKPTAQEPNVLEMIRERSAAAQAEIAAEAAGVGGGTHAA